jgi:recombination protein U
MAIWKSRGLRGSILEEMINRTNEAYLESGLALIQKIPTPITPVEMNEKKQITLAYFDKKSTVDYIGAVQGLPVCFDAKECATETFSLQNIHEHQVRFMNDFEKQGGIAFFLIQFKSLDIFYYMRLDDLMVFWNRSLNGGRKSFRFDELNKDYVIEMNEGLLIPYLNYIQKDIDARE